MRSSYAQFFHEHVFMKEAGTQRTTPFHQDIPYYPLSWQSGNQYICRTGFRRSRHGYKICSRFTHLGEDLFTKGLAK